ncbi:hypothetical protein C9374_002417 [Naegleria lovaniensis]|uniref:MYND-type domain-containing protein n=1 Tax=Naegleria lovaniensis TaxID=51637 RepID=A0AA88GUQ7_NAELO|nr:uncharacterized protein C9374_002417 [Naegleria lovaniensis]KAG2386673.1 hypothetical protein C9374_002417 [Naegleria lovaniensis]
MTPATPKESSTLQSLKRLNQQLNQDHQQKLEDITLIQPSIEELKQYTHTKLGSKYLKARLLMDEGKRLFFSGQEEEGLKYIAKAFWLEEKACRLTMEERAKIIRYCDHIQKSHNRNATSDPESMKKEKSLCFLDSIYNACCVILIFMFPGVDKYREMGMPMMIEQDGSFRSYDMIGSCYAFANNWLNALKYFLMAFEKNPNEFEIMYSIGIAYKNLLDFKSSREWLQRYVEQSELEDFKRPSAHYELASLALVIDNTNMKEVVKQAQLARYAMTKRLPFLGPLTTGTQELVETLVRVMKDVDALPVNTKKVMKEVGEVINNQTKKKEELPEPSPEQLKLKEEGNDFFKDNNFTEAIKCYNNALLETSSKIDSILHSNLAICHAKLGCFSESLCHAEKSVICDPYFAKGYYRKAFALMKLNRMQEANTNAIIYTSFGTKISKGHELESIRPDSEIILVRNALQFKHSLFSENVALQNLTIVVTDEDTYTICDEITRPISMIGIGREKPTFLEMPLVACGSGGKLTLIDCVVNGAHGSGGVMAHDEGSILKMTNCQVYDCARAAVEIVSGARAEIDKCELFACGQGIIGYNNGKSVKVTNSKIYQHAKEGVLIAQKCSAFLTNVSIFKNTNFGISVDNTGAATLKDCVISESLYYGICVKGDCPLQVTDSQIISNHCGGVRIGINYSAPVFFNNCRVSNNNGPGIFQELNRKVSSKSLTQNLQNLKINAKDIDRQMKKISNELRSVANVTLTNVVEDGNEEKNEHPSKVAKAERLCAFCNSHSETMSKCSKCKTVIYCGKQCQIKDWRNHKVFCNSLTTDYTIVCDLAKAKTIEKKEFFSNLAQSSTYMTRQERNAGKYKDGKKFIVKIQTRELSRSPDEDLTLYNENRDLIISFPNRDLYTLIMKCGVLGDNQMTSKKVFLYAIYDQPTNSLHIYTHELAPFQKW